MMLFAQIYIIFALFGSFITWYDRCMQKGLEMSALKYKGIHNFNLAGIVVAFYVNHLGPTKFSVIQKS